MKKSTLYKLISYCRPYYKALAIVIVLSLVYVLSTLWAPILLGKAIDLLVTPGHISFSLLAQQLLYVAIVIVIGASSQWLLSRVTNYITYHIMTDLRNKLFDTLHCLPIVTLDNHPHGDLVSRVTNDIDLIGTGLLQSLTSLFTGIITVFGTIIIMCMINVTVASVVIILTPVSLLVSSYIAKKTYVYLQEQLVIRGELNSYVEEMITNQKLIKAFTYESYAKEKFYKINQRMHISGIKSQFLGALINPTTRVINNFVYAAVGVFGAIRVLSGHFTVGLLSSFLTYANQYTKPFNEISAVITEMQTALAASERVFSILEAKQEEKSKAIKTISSFMGTMQIQDLSFSYEANKPFIEQVSLSVLAGEKIAIVGQTGCGKTTLINLFMRFFDQNKGHIYIDGVDTLQMDKAYLRSLFGMVLQDTWLFTGTIKENIAYGRQQVSDEEIIEAATQARIHKFIMTLPQGYDTVIHADSDAISQGQKQMLCIARVMLVRPPMLILDEATSSIDTRTEQQVQAAFDSLMQGKTTFIVAHRLATIQKANTILVMDSGKIVEQGNHRDLLTKKGYYYRLYNSQFPSS